MKNRIFHFVFVVLSLLFLFSYMLLADAAPKVSETDGKLRIIVFGAHPDDCELKRNSNDSTTNTK